MVSRQFLAKVTIGASILVGGSPLALADTASGSINVKVSVAKECSVAATSDVDFGAPTVAVGASSTEKQGGTISVKCRKQAGSVTVQLQKGAGGVSGGTMTDNSVTPPNTLAYSLYKPVTTTWDTNSTGACAYTTAWDASGLNLGAITNTGTMTVGVCAETTIDDTTAAGVYSDTLNVVLTY